MIRELDHKDPEVFSARRLFLNVLEDIAQYYSPQQLELARFQNGSTALNQDMKYGLLRLFVYEQDGVQGMLIRSTLVEEGTVGVNWLMAAQKRKGVGSALMKDCIERARQEGKRSVDLIVAGANERANNLYQKLGFQKRDEYSEEGLVFKHMSLEL